MHRLFLNLNVLLKGWCIVNPVCREVTDYVRSCERLLTKQETLTDDERGLLEYYVKELSRELLSDKPTMWSSQNESTVAPTSATNRLVQTDAP